MNYFGYGILMMIIALIADFIVGKPTVIEGFRPFHLLFWIGFTLMVIGLFIIIVGAIVESRRKKDPRYVFRRFARSYSYFRNRRNQGDNYGV